MLLRLSLVCLFFLVETSFPGKTAESMRQHFGAPVSETFLVRPGVVVTASYGKNGHFCELLVSPQNPATAIKSADQTAKTIDSNLLTKIIDELVPESERGRGLSGNMLNIRCLPADDCAGSGSTWEKVSIYRNGGACYEHYATIQWSDVGCAIQTGQDRK